MDFDFNKFCTSLKENDKSSKNYRDCSGFAIVVEAVYNLKSTRSMDFDSFSYQDVIHTFEMMEISAYHADEDDESGETLTIAEDSPLCIIDQVESVVYNFYHFKNKFFGFEEREFFI